MYPHVVFIMKDLFHWRKFFWSTPLQRDFFLCLKIKKSNNLYFHRKRIIFLSFCRRKFSSIITRGFHFETFISKKKILLIHTSPEGFYPVYEIQYFLTIDIFPEGNDSFILLQKDSLQFIKIWISFWKIYFTEENSSDQLLYRRISSCIEKLTLFMIDIFSERNYFLVLL